MTKRDRTSPLWAITCLFGDLRGRRRLANYRSFRAALQVPLVTVVMPFHGRPPLGPGDAEILVDAAPGDVLWQKERLLNLALGHLPSHCRYVAWIDSDIVFRRADWPTLARAALGEVPVAQLFDRALECPPDADAATLDPAGAEGVSRSFAARWRDGDLGEVLRVREGSRVERDCASGMAWAARRDYLERFGFYDACIAGAGDRAMVGAMTGRMADTVHALRMGPAFRAHYLQWARPVSRHVDGRIACVPGEVVHLWHGDPRRRGHVRRHLALHEQAFDPRCDVMGEPDGAWRFATDKPGLRRFLRGYFAERRAQEAGGA